MRKKVANQPVQLLLYALLSLVIILLGSQPGVQLALEEYLGLSSNTVAVSNTSTFGQLEKAVVNRVVDGDTIVLSDGRTIRYLNSDTPETKKPNTPKQCYGDEASQKNIELVEGKEVWLKSDKENTDRYGRDLRWVWIAGADTGMVGESVNAYLVRNGFARSVGIKPNVSQMELFDNLQQQAKSQNLGVWACPKPFEE